MKRFPRILLLSCLTALLLTGTALADMGPKGHLTGKVENGPEEPYYLDILAEGNYENGDDAFYGLDWSYTDEETAALDQELLGALRATEPVWKFVVLIS